MGKILTAAAYAVYAAFWLRFFTHFLAWWRTARRFDGPSVLTGRTSGKACALTAVDVIFFGRLLRVNGPLWAGEWSFHLSFFLVILRHLRFFLNPVPSWVWSMQTPGLIAGYLLPFSLVYILVVRLLTKREKYASAANVFLLALVLAMSSIGLLMHLWFRADLVDVKLFIVGLLSLEQAPLPGSLLFALHFGMVLVLVALLPTHIFTAPFVMLEARRREEALRTMIHEE